MKTTLNLPDRYLITPEPAAFEADFFLDRLEQALQSGIALVQLRSKTMSADEYAALATQALDVCRTFSARMIVNHIAFVADTLGADGIHIGSRHLMMQRKRPVSGNILFSAACHNAAQLSQAEVLGADFVTLSPVLKTRTHPDAAPLGWDAFADLLALTSTPAYALGGMEPVHIAQAQSAGALGIAAIGSLWPGPRS
jgi:thiamine-phosphate diphosphorylase